MDTTSHSNIPIETLSLLGCDVRNFDFNHPIKNIFFDNIGTTSRKRTHKIDKF